MAKQTTPRQDPGSLSIRTEQRDGHATGRRPSHSAINTAAPKFNLKRAVIISEDEHDNGYLMEFDDDVVFVLPNKGRADLTGANLVNTAKLLMACTPNGI